MIDFLRNWIEQITIAVIIVSIFELILPKGNLKKYIKVVLGIYIIFSIIEPFVRLTNIYDINELHLDSYTTTEGRTLNQTSMNSRIETLYIEQMKKDISNDFDKNGYIVDKCDIDAKLDSQDKNPGIHKISLSIKSKMINKVEIGKENDDKTKEIEELKEKLAEKYEIDKSAIEIKLK